MKRYAFSPARLVLGLALLGIALTHVMAAFGHWDVPLRLLAPLVPAALLLGACTAVVTRLLRHGCRAVRAPAGTPTRGRGQPDRG